MVQRDSNTNFEIPTCLVVLENHKYAFIAWYWYSTAWCNSTPRLKMISKQYEVVSETKISSTDTIDPFIKNHLLTSNAYVVIYCRRNPSEVCPTNVHFNIILMSLMNDNDFDYHQTFNIRRPLEGTKIVDHSDVFGASPVGAAPTPYTFSTLHLASMDWVKTTATRDENHLSFGI